MKLKFGDWLAILVLANATFDVIFGVVMVTGAREWIGLVLIATGVVSFIILYGVTPRWH